MGSSKVKLSFWFFKKSYKQITKQGLSLVPQKGKELVFPSHVIYILSVHFDLFVDKLLFSGFHNLCYVYVSKLKQQFLIIFC